MESNIKVKLYEKDDHQKVLDFLKNISSLVNIEEELFENAALIIEDDEVVGMISYEMFRAKALIRYFIFDKDVEECYLVEMYEMFFQMLKSKNIKSVFVLINNPAIKQMFKDLGFVQFDKKEFYLTEENIINTKYKDATVMIYEI